MGFGCQRLFEFEWKGGRGGRLFEAGHLLTFSAFKMGAYSRWPLIRGWALIQINTVFKQWNIHFDQQTLGITKKVIWVIKEQNMQNLFCVPCICMFTNEHRENLFYYMVA